jgi:AcrR family transcriptional regulator
MGEPVTGGGGAAGRGMGAVRGSQPNQAPPLARVLEVAIRIGDEESLDALTMRRLAGDLGVGTMTLYRYFRTKNELLDGMADEILGSLVLPPMEGVGAAEALAVVARSLRDMMRAQVLQALVDIGLEPGRAVRAYGLLLVYALGFSGYELPRPWGRDPQQVEGVGELRRQRGLFYQALPQDEFPVMVSLSDVLVTLPSDEQFEWGLAVLVAGILAGPPPEPRPR